MKLTNFRPHNLRGSHMSNY